MWDLPGLVARQSRRFSALQFMWVSPLSLGLAMLVLARNLCVLLGLTLMSLDLNPVLRKTVLVGVMRVVTCLSSGLLVNLLVL